ncbi:hypothetical protein CcaverHIS002_0400440 [Cutaneotrichosporon cavernicola]|nr:hypothetical protein CcaverHIS002_0400440 [Cutaneotrichosporon cavernicola]
MSRDATGTTAATVSTEDSAGSSDDDSDELDDDDYRQERGMSTSSVAIPPDQQLSLSELAYVLEVIQQPQRARACGFGDKDRRPLSPPPIIQLRVFDKLGNAIKPHAIDVHRFILMVDLWNGDRTQQRSIVMHPGARPDQYALFTHAASRAASTHRLCSLQLWLATLRPPVIITFPIISVPTTPTLPISTRLRPMATTWTS